MKIAVLAGGRSPEREVSLRSGHRVMMSLNESGHDAFVVDPADAPLVQALEAQGPEVAYLALHGREGEDGTVQRLLDLLGIPYTGTAAMRCAAASDKIMAKERLHAAGIPTPTWASIEATALRELGGGAALPKAIERVGLPCLVKPSRGGSALGISFIDSVEGLAPAVMAALAYSGDVIIEAKVKGTEVTASFIGDPLQRLPLVEIVAKRGVYDYAARYTAGETEYFTPARLEADVADRCIAVAQQACSVLGLKGVARVDMIVDAEGVPQVLEVNVSPGMTETSLLPMAAKAAGASLAEVCSAVLASAL